MLNEIRRSIENDKAELELNSKQQGELGDSISHLEFGEISRAYGQFQSVINQVNREGYYVHDDAKITLSTLDKLLSGESIDRTRDFSALEEVPTHEVRDYTMTAVLDNVTLISDATTRYFSEILGDMSQNLASLESRASSELKTLSEMVRYVDKCRLTEDPNEIRLIDVDKLDLGEKEAAFKEYLSLYDELDEIDECIKNTSCLSDFFDGTSFNRKALESIANFEGSDEQYTSKRSQLGDRLSDAYILRANSESCIEKYNKDILIGGGTDTKIIQVGEGRDVRYRIEDTECGKVETELGELALDQPILTRSEVALAVEALYNDKEALVSRIKVARTSLSTAMESLDGYQEACHEATVKAINHETLKTEICKDIVDINQAELNTVFMPHLKAIQDLNSINNRCLMEMNLLQSRF